MLPHRDGVGPSCVALPVGPWAGVLDFLAERFADVGRDTWLARLQSGEVLDEQGLVVAADAAYRPHARLYYYRSVPAEPPIPFAETVLFQDDLLVVADKPHFLPVTPSGRYVQETLLVRLKRRLGLETLVPMHRLDRETAGLVLFTVQPGTRDRYQALFRERRVLKGYEAVAPHLPGAPWPCTRHSRIVSGDSFMTMREVAGPPNAQTRIELLQQRGDWARYGLQPSTGVKHQLRVHMMALGLPIRHDLIYPTLQPDTLANGLRPYPPPLQLLARTITFTDPVTGRERHFESGRVLELPD